MLDDRLELQFGSARIEIAHSTKVFKKPEDITAELQMVFSNK